METMNINEESLLKDSRELTSGLGAVAWATLEMLKRGGMSKSELDKLEADMNRYFAKPSNEECNAVLRVVEQRLVEDKQNNGIWY